MNFINMFVAYRLHTVSFVDTKKTKKKEGRITDTAEGTERKKS